MMKSRPALIPSPISDNIIERTFVSSWDGSTQTFLEKKFQAAEGDAQQLIVVYLHGAASHQDQGMTAGIYENSFARWGEELALRSALYICPEYRGGSWMGPAAEADLRDILLQIRCSRPCGKMLLCGGSMGGTSALIFASRHPNDVDGVYAMCPATDVVEMFSKFPEQFTASYGGSPSEVPEVYAERCSRNFADRLSLLPIFLIHGSNDIVIPVEHSRLLVEKLREQGARFRYIELAGGDHNAPISFPLRDVLHFLITNPNLAPLS